MNNWTPDQATAHDFRQSLQAINEASRQEFTQVELVYRFEELVDDVVMPLFPPASVTILHR